MLQWTAWLWVLPLASLLSLTAACGARRAVSKSDAERLMAKPDVHLQVGAPVQARLRFVSGGARDDREVTLLSHSLARPLERAASVPESVDRRWQREPPPPRRGPLVDPADVMASRMLEAMRARGLAGPRTSECRAGTCSPELLLDVTIERVELSIAERPVRPVLPLFHATAVLMDPFGRALYRGRCELGLTGRLPTGGRGPPLMTRAQDLLDDAAFACAEQLAAELWRAVTGDQNEKSPSADSTEGLQPHDW